MNKKQIAKELQIQNKASQTILDGTVWEYNYSVIEKQILLNQISIMNAIALILEEK